MRKLDNLWRQLCVLDTECTHADPTQAEIVELAVATWNQGWHVQSALFGSCEPMPPEASAVTHIHPDWLKNKPTFTQSVDQVVNLLVNHSTHFVSHNVKYGCHVLGRALHEIEPEWARQLVHPDRWICTLRLSKWAWPHMHSYAQNYLRYALGLNVHADLVSHRAGPDVQVCAALLEQIVCELVQQQLLDVNADLATQLVYLTQQPIVVNSWPFGKHKGKAFKELDTDYLLWALDNVRALREQDPDFDPDLAETVRLTLERRLTD